MIFIKNEIDKTTNFDSIILKIIDFLKKKYNSQI